MTDKLTREWTYRDPLVTVTYPKGWTGTLPAKQRAAAQEAQVLADPTPAPRKTK